MEGEVEAMRPQHNPKASGVSSFPWSHREEPYAGLLENLTP